MKLPGRSGKKDETSRSSVWQENFRYFCWLFAEHAADWEGINDVTKCLCQNMREKSDWENTIFLKSLADIKKRKRGQRF